MSINLPNVAITEFDAMVHQEFQAKGFQLKQTVRLRNDVQGNTVKFPIIEGGVATKKAPQDDVTPINAEWKHAVATLENWNAADYSDIFDQAEVNFDERRELAEMIAMALGRTSDQIIMDAVNASATTNIIPDGGTAFTFDKFLDVNRYLNKNSARGDRYLLVSAEAERALLTNEQLTSTDFVRNQAIQNGGLDGLNILGMTIKVIPDYTKDGVVFGLPKAGNIRTCLAYTKPAVGMGIGINMRTDITYENIKTSWLVNSNMKAGAVAIDDLGIVKIDIDETV